MSQLRQLRIDTEILRDFPELIIGVVVGQELDNQGSDPEIEKALAEASQSALEKLGSTPPAQHPFIATWREAYRFFGAKPKKFSSSIESLVRRTLKSGPPRSINKLVDLYNIVSLNFLVPVGGEDLDSIQGDLVLRYARAGDPPALLLGESEARPAKPGEIVYCDDQGPVCRRWNWKEADRTKLSSKTTHALFVIEALPPIPRTVLRSALSELANSLEQYCGGKTHRAFLDAHNPTVALDAL